MSFEQQLISWRRELHQNPELSLQEVATTARIRDWLQSGGLTLLPYDLKTGLVAEVGSGDKVIALRADIDALPIEEATGLPYRSQNEGVMHACGHDIHTSVMLGAALLLKEREAELPGRVRILFQPAEENFGGAKTLIRAGALEDVSAIFGMHNEPGLPVGEFATRGGAFLRQRRPLRLQSDREGGACRPPTRRKGCDPAGQPTGDGAAERGQSGSEHPRLGGAQRDADPGRQYLERAAGERRAGRDAAHSQQ